MKHGITLITPSLVGAPSLFLYKRSDGLKLLNKVVHLQGWCGFVVCFWGIFSLVNCSFIRPGQSYGHFFFWLSQIVINFFQVVFGYLLGYDLISRYVYSGNKQARQKGDKLLLKLAPIQGKIAIAAFITGALYIIWILSPFTTSSIFV